MLNRDPYVTLALSQWSGRRKFAFNWKTKRGKKTEETTKSQPYSSLLIGHILQESIMFFTGSLRANIKLCGGGGGGGGHCAAVFQWNKCLVVQT